MKLIKNITTNLIDLKLYSFNKQIYVVEIPNQYDRAMLFCRYQEYYESEFKDIKGQHFTLEYFMKLYSEKHGEGVFTYPNDWSGFNIPLSEILNCYQHIKDNMNEYDEIMEQIFDEIYSFCTPEDPENAYVIGIDCVTPEDPETLEHELAHALFYSNDEYNKSVTDLLMTTLDPEESNMFTTKLQSMGYAEHVWIDEIQAYLISIESAKKYFTITENLIQLAFTVKNEFNKFIK